MSRRVLRRLSLACPVAAAVVFAPGDARAQLHWDAAVQGGVVKRFLSSKAAGTDDASFGPGLELHGHVALIPLLRVGAYVAHDASPAGSNGTRQITSFGIRAKGAVPWLRSE